MNGGELNETRNGQHSRKASFLGGIAVGLHVEKQKCLLRGMAYVWTWNDGQNWMGPRWRSHEILADREIPDGRRILIQNKASLNWNKLTSETYLPLNKL